MNTRQLFWIAFLIGILVMALATPALGQEARYRSQIVAAAHKYGVEPEIALAVAKVESNFTQSARGTHGEVGIFQLLPRYHGSEIYNSAGNIDAGLRHLADVRAACSPRYGSAWVVCFNLGVNYKRLKHPKLFPYYRKVIQVAGTL